MSTANIKHSGTIHANLLQRLPCGPFQIRPKIFVVKIILPPKPQGTALEPASSGSFRLQDFRCCIVGDISRHSGASLRCSLYANGCGPEYLGFGKYANEDHPYAQTRD